MKPSRLWIALAAAALALVAVALWGEMNHGVKPAPGVAPAGHETADPAGPAKRPAPELPPPDDGTVLVG
jgi:hypothetical protein